MIRCFVLIGFSLMFVTLLNAQSVDYEMKNLDFTAAENQPLEVFMDVDAGEVYIEGGGGRLTGHVDVEYEADRFKSRLDFDEKKNRLRVKVDGKKWHKMHGENSGPIVQVVLPDSVHIRLKTKLKAGEVQLDLGGLCIEELDLSAWAGEVNVRFEEPNPITMSLMDINLHVGEATLERLGNARFEKADLNSGIGELSVDFTGDILNKSMARVDLDIGETDILLPSDIGVRMQIGGAFSFMSSKDIDSDFYKRGRYFYTHDFEAADTQFSLRVTPGLGELRVERD
jgi:hypothetical protein